MSVLSDEAIISYRDSGNIIIEPFRLDDVNTASYDVRLGPWFYREQPGEQLGSIYTPENISNIYSPDAAEKIWGIEPEFADLAGDWIKYRPEIDYRGIDAKDRIILIRPQENLLCHTVEFIGGKTNITTQMKARSTIGRLLLNVCQCAGQGDVGYYNRWTMEVYNRSSTRTLMLVVGRRIAQIVFDTTTDTHNSYHNAGHYQTDENIKDMIGNWEPSMMLPKAHTDKDINHV